MGGATGILLIVVFAAIVAGVIWLTLYLRKLRRQELAAVAQQLGLSYHPGYLDYHNYYDCFELFKRGHGRHSYDLIHGRRAEMEVKMFDYSYKTGSGKNQTTHVRSVCILEMQLRYGFPYVIIRPEGFFDKFASAIGFNDIDFESVEFSKKFFVKGEDRRFAYDLIHPRMMEFLIRVGRVCIELYGKSMLIHHDRRLAPRYWPGMLSIGEAFFDKIPERLISGDR
jgi:hypothetical protein